MIGAVNLISVIIPVYNVEAYLEQCLQSVAAQTYGKLEIICVDDGSTDGSAEIAQRFAATEPRCRVITQHNQGLSVARNTGVAAALGQWVFFLDSDDWLPEQALEVLARAEADVECAVVSGAVLEYWEDTGTYKPYKKPEKRATGHLDLYRQDFFALETVAWNKLYRRDALRTCPFVPGLVHEDLDFYWRFFSAYPKVYAISDTVIHYRRRPGTLSQQKAYDHSYQDHYIHIVDTAFKLADRHRSLAYHAGRQSLKYLKYLKDKGAPYDRYLKHIDVNYSVRDTPTYRLALKLKKLLNI